MAAPTMQRSMGVVQKSLTIFSKSTFPAVLRHHNFLLMNTLKYRTQFPPSKSISTSISLRDQATNPAQKSERPDGETSESQESKTEETTPREKELMSEKGKLLEEIKDLNDKYKRSLADNENIRRAKDQQISNAKMYGIQDFVKDLIEVADILGNATESVPKEALSEGNAHLKNLFEGLQMTEVQLQKVLKRHGVSQLDPLGEKFNPNFHQALFQKEDKEKEPGSVCTVIKVGYKLHDRCVRPAMVEVVKS